MQLRALCSSFCRLQKEQGQSYNLQVAAQISLHAL